MSKPGPKKQRARTARRRAERQAGRAAGGRAVGGDAPRVHAVGQWNTDNLGADGLYDDCPMCRALRAAGAVPDESGMVVMTPQLQARYEHVLDEIIAEEGWPQQAMRVTGEALTNWFDAIHEDLQARGYPTDIETMSDAELADHMDRVEEASNRLFGRPGAGRRPALAS